MFLRSLTLKGFKSFADRTTLEFAPGVSVIVGPNGSGKSNLVDAMAWALGEQGARALRGGQMADVIFAGSPQRAALGMAEVKLVIDNSAGKIPVPMSEIEITRSIFRAGDSEYRVGGQIVRLMDIQELLSDSGIGRALHTVVSQGQLEEALTARPEERRQYIEEAAGIAKHRRRKERAQRKLAGLENDLLRLQDVMTELKRQLKPLKQQAEMARRHEELTAQAEEAAWRLAAARLRGLRSRKETQTPAWERGIELRGQAKKRIEELDRRIALLGSERETAASGLVAAENALRRAQTDKAEAEMRLREADRLASDAHAKLNAEATRAARVSAIEEELGREEAALVEREAEVAAREAELEAAERVFREAEQARAEAEEERRRLLEESAARRAEMETLRMSLAASERERERVEQGLDAVRTRIAELESRRAELDRSVEELDAGAEPSIRRRADLERERLSLAEEVGTIEDDLRAIEARRELVSARLADVRETAGSRFLNENPGRAIGLLRELLHAQPGHERALAAALGPLADAVVYEHEDHALADARGGGGAVLAVASGDAPSFSLPGERSLMSVVGADPRVRGLAATVLRDVYLAASIEEAATKRRRHPRAAFVTSDGTMVGSAFIQTASEHGARERDLSAELSRIEHDSAAAHNRMEPLRRKLEDIGAEVEALSEIIDAADAAITRAADEIAEIDPQLASSRKEEEFLGHRLEALEGSVEAGRTSLENVRPLHQEMPEMPHRPEPPVAARVSVESARRDRTEIRSRLERLRIEHATLSAETPEILRAAWEAAESSRASAEEARGAADAAFEEASRARDEVALAERRATSAEAEANREWREASATLDRLREDYEEEDRLRGELDRRIEEAERLLRDGHSKDPEEALMTLSDEDTVESLERQADVVARRLGLLGRVNLLAGGEFEALQERYDFMNRELEDVRRARRDLLEVIRRVDDEVVSLFDSAFKDVAREFERIVKELFPGGEGRLLLTDPADLLNTGVEIEARPGRKRVKRLSLLSGGERALTALGFLFAIFSARPSPFYLLDEVEAALDDVNLHRMLGMIQGFAKESQVLIVTHQKRTMEIADMLYGVSMGKDGSSRAVCQRMGKADAAQRSQPVRTSAEAADHALVAGHEDGEPIDQAAEDVATQGSVTVVSEPQRVH
jgi:chromosome segregation protein